MFNDKDSRVVKMPGKDVYKISRTGNYAVIAAVTGGLSGLLGAVIGTLSWNENENLKNSKGTYIIGATAGCLIIGGIIGVFIPRDIVIYKSGPEVSFEPGLMSVQQQTYASIGIKIHLK